MHLNSQNKCWLEITPQQHANEQRLTSPSESQTTVLKKNIWTSVVTSFRTPQDSGSKSFSLNVFGLKEMLRLIRRFLGLHSRFSTAGFGRGRMHQKLRLPSLLRWGHTSYRQQKLKREALEPCRGRGRSKSTISSSVLLYF